MTSLTLRHLIAAVALCSTPVLLGAQEAEDRTLLNWRQMRAIIDEASGERAMHHLLELVPYQRVRPLSEYRADGHFRESEVMARFAREYGYSTVEVESFPSGGQLYQPTKGQLWMVEPKPRKLFDIYDTPVALAGNSANGDITADVVDVGNGGRAEDYAGKDVKGKIVLGSAGAAALQRLGVFERGAVGIMTYSLMRADDQPDEFISSSIGAAGPNGTPAGFGWSISARVAREMQNTLAAGRAVKLRSIVQAQTFPGRQEVIHATIQGDGSTQQDIVVSAHVYEGLIKQGANDDNSGAAMTLEMGRAYIDLVKQGLLPRPKRTIHFLWVQEISGTNAWLNAHKDLEKRIIADLNYDMEGLRLTASGATWLLMRTPDSYPSFLNDVAQNFLEYVAEISRERVRYRANGYAPVDPVVSANGSRDAFYIKVDKYYGASDHATYMQHGIPAVIFNTWPDYWYHSSQDTPDKLDPTMFKRAAVVSIGAMTVLAAADDPMALRVAADALGRGAERMAANQRKALGYLGDVTSAPQLTQAYKDARATVRHQSNIEKAVVKSSGVLFANPDSGAKRLAVYEPLVEARTAALLAEVTATFRLAAATWRVSATEPVQSDLEKQAARLTVERIAPAAGAPGGGGGGGGGFGGPQNADVAAAQRKIPQHMSGELNALLNRKMTALEIRDFLTGEFEPLSLDDLMSYLRAMEKAGTLKLTERAVK
ncbi:MAG: M28 family peptidase [Gemmatimonadaceae bacterium]|nr:M28 family peptidase [Gemmatimonadaceae bacterium]